MTKLARAIHGIPVVVSTLARAAMFPTPETDQRVHNLETGYIERFDGASWLADTPTARGGHVFDVKAYGAKGDGSTNDTAAYLLARAAAVARGGGTIYFPDGDYVLNKITLGIYLQHKGAGKQATTLIPSSSASGAFVDMDTGVVQHAHVADMEIRGPGQTHVSGLKCFHLVGVSDGVQGGLWFTNFRNLYVNSFPGESFWFVGGGSTFDVPHQFNHFANVSVSLSSNTGTVPVFRLTGQCGQFTFDESCLFEGPVPGSNASGLEVFRTERKNGAVDDTSPYSITFLGSSLQDCVIGARIIRASSVHFNGCYFENVATAVQAETSAQSVSVRDSVFEANVTVGLKALTSAHIASSGNHFTTGVTTHYSTDGTGVIVVTDDEHSGVQVVSTALTTQITAAASITMGRYRTALINTSGTPIATITSDCAPGERITLKAHSGQFLLATGGNIALGGWDSPMTVPQDTVVTLVRYDLGGTWFIASIGGPPHKLVQATAYTPVANAITPNANQTVWRTAHNANLTVNNPTGLLLDGFTYSLDVKNSSAGAITVTLGAGFAGTFPGPGAGKRRTQSYVYDAVTTTLIPLGAQSGDI